jgi:hypothetical protein
MLLEEIEDVVGRVECNLAGESIRQDSQPNRDGSGNDCPARGDLDVDVLDALVILVLLDVLILLNPAETKCSTDECWMFRWSTKKLGMNVSSQIPVLQEGHEP